MQLQEQRYYLSEEYLEIEVNSEERHEYIDGQIILKQSGNPNHNIVVGKLGATLNLAFKQQPYQIFILDQRLWIPQKRMYIYPDVMVIADKLEFAEGRRDTLINPVFITEVLSKSTKSYDRDEKFAAYRTIPNFQEYVLIDQYKMHVEQYFKTDNNRWIFSEFEDGEESLNLASVPCQILLTDIYDKVDFNVEE
jgi:Uma2 family endonuclease